MKLDWQYRALGLPPGVALTRPKTSSAPAPVCVLLVGDGFASALAMPLRALLGPSGSSLLVAPAKVQASPSHVVFAFERAPKGAPERAWQVPLAASHAKTGPKMLWLDLLEEPLVLAPQATEKLKLKVVRPPEKVLRRATNGMVSAVGMAGLAGFVSTWTGAPMAGKLPQKTRKS